jgi:hypothetical protein
MPKNGQGRTAGLGRLKSPSAPFARTHLEVGNIADCASRTRAAPAHAHSPFANPTLSGFVWIGRDWRGLGGQTPPRWDPIHVGRATHVSEKFAFGKTWMGANPTQSPSNRVGLAHLHSWPGMTHASSLRESASVSRRSAHRKRRRRRRSSLRSHRQQRSAAAGGSGAPPPAHVPHLLLPIPSHFPFSSSLFLLGLESDRDGGYILGSPRL